MNVLITGAFGRVGTALVEHLPDEYALSYLDRSIPDGYTGREADVAEYDAIRPAFDGVDAVVHLAGASAVDSDWEDVLRSNVIGVRNALEASADAGVETFVFASSNHVVGMYEREHAPELYDPEYDLTVDHTAPPRPDSYYGSSKLFGEGLTRYFVERRAPEMAGYSLRIGTVLEPEFDHPYGSAEQGVADGDWERGSASYERSAARMHATWQSRRDVAGLVAACLADESVSYDVFYGVSDNEARWFDISHAEAAVGYEPNDSADDWDGRPSHE